MKMKILQKLMFFICNILGTGIIFYERDHDTDSTKYQFFCNLISIAINGTLIYSFGRASQSVGRKLMNYYEKNKILKMNSLEYIFLSYFILSSSFLFATTVTYMNRYKNYPSLSGKLKIIRKKLKTEKTKIWRLLTITFLAVTLQYHKESLCTFTFIGPEYNTALEQCSLSIVAYTFNLYIVSFHVLASDFKHTFRSINNFLEKYNDSFASSTETQTPAEKAIIDGMVEQTSTLIDLYWELNRLIKSTNDIFGDQLLTALVYLFSQMTSTCYHIYLGLTYPMLNQPVFIFVFVCSGLLSFFILITQLLVLISPCVSTTNEANRTVKLICRLNMKNIPPKVRERLEAFTLDNHQGVRFSAWGLFELNPTIMTSLAGTVSTYLVILIQLKPDEEY